LAFDAKQFAGLIILVDNRSGGKIAAPSIRCRGAICQGGGAPPTESDAGDKAETPEGKCRASRSHYKPRCQETSASAPALSPKLFILFPV
jgi:hypothetical protein